MNRKDAIEFLLGEIDLWLDMYDKDSEVYAELTKAIETLREAG